MQPVVGLRLKRYVQITSAIILNLLCALPMLGVRQRCRLRPPAVVVVMYAVELGPAKRFALLRVDLRHNSH